MRMNAMLLAAAVLLALLQPAHADNVTYLGSSEQVSGYPHPLFSTSFAQAGKNVTTYRFRITNPAATPAASFRIWLSSNFTWFRPQELDYELMPDGVDDDSPYWDIPPIETNETAEVSFAVDGMMGLPNAIGVSAEPLARWETGCSNLAPHNASERSVLLAAGYLNVTNRSQEVTGYYEEGSLLLAYIEGYGTFAVFSINATDPGQARPVSDEPAIAQLVAAYADAATPPSAANLSMLHEALLRTKELKYRPEHECYMLTGMDRFACVDRPSCLYACFSVQVCSLIGQSGYDFLDTIQDYNRSIFRTNSLLDGALDSSQRMAGAPSYETGREAMDDLVSLNRAQTAVMFHPLIMSYGFCEPPDYGVPGQTGARREVLDYLADTCVHGEEERIASEAAHAAPLLAPPPEKVLRNVTAADAGAVAPAMNVTAPAANATKPPESQNPEPETGNLASATIPWPAAAALLLALLAISAWAGWRAVRH